MARLQLPAPRLGRAARPAGVPPEELTQTNAASRLLERMKDDNWSRLDPDQVEPFLTQRKRSAEALLAAAQATGDKAYLREAMEKFPNDPRVAYAAYYLSGPYDNQQPADTGRRQWLERFKAAAPDNALPHYLAARDDFKAGRTDAAVRELLAAAGKPIQDYALAAILNREEAYRAAGIPEAEATVSAFLAQPLPELTELKQLSSNLADLANAYRQAGDPASAEAALQIAANLGRELDRSGPFLINDLVAIAIEASALKAMDPNQPVSSDGQTAQGRLDALQQSRDELKATGKQVGALLPTLSDLEVVSYFDRVRLFGEWEASRWLVKTRSGP